MATIERNLVRAWRKAYGLTLDELGRGFRPQRDRHRVGQLERIDSSMTVTLILETIAALERATGESIVPGARDPSDELRLSTFFAGPDDRRPAADLLKAARVYAGHAEDEERE